MINKIYIIWTIFNSHRLYNSIRDIKLHFPDTSIEVCIWVNKQNVEIKDWIIKTDWNHFWSITEMKISKDTDWCWYSHVGCSMSHLNVLNDAIENNYDTIMIVEDDLILHSKAKIYFKTFMDHVPEDREVLRLSWFPYNMENLKLKNPYWYTWRNVRWCEMYMLNKSWIKKMYNDFVNNFYTSVDKQLNLIEWINLYISSFPLWLQWNNYELDNSDREWNYRNEYQIKEWSYVLWPVKKYLKYK